MFIWFVNEGNIRKDERKSVLFLLVDRFIVDLAIQVYLCMHAFYIISKASSLPIDHLTEIKYLRMFQLILQALRNNLIVAITHF